MVYVKKDTSKLVPVTSIDDIVNLSNNRKAVLLCMGRDKRWLAAKAIRMMTIDTVLKFINNKQLLKDNDEERNQ